MTATFEEYLTSSEPYMSVVRDGGDLPWFEDAERRGRVAARLGLPADTPALEVRRALFERKNPNHLERSTNA